MKGIWLTWEHQRRNIGISSALNWQLYEIALNKSPLYRYLYSSVRTLLILLREKPEVVIVQNPSIVLAVLASLLKPIMSYKLVMDAHNAGIYPSEGENRWLMILAKWLQKQADLVVVTNEELKKVVEDNGGRGFILPDRLPDAHETKPYVLDGKFRVAFICTYAADEPYDSVFEAARMLPEDIIIYVTGKYQSVVDTTCLPGNVRLLGFVPDDEFWALLNSVDYIMDLTTREGCLVCGAYEGVSLRKPLILSDTKAIREYFYKGTVYVKPNAESIYNGILEAIKKRDELKTEIDDLKETLSQAWNSRIEEFNKILLNLR